jgi:hypothetical protein
MITEDQKKKFKQTLGHHYTSKVIAVLEDEGVKDSFGKTHSPQMIIQVMNGETSHELIELAILKAVEKQTKENKRIERIKNKILKSA